VTHDELISIIRRVEPVIREHAARGERERRVPKETADALRAAGLFKLWLPKEFGGWQMEPLAACRAIEEVARIDSAAAWMFQMCSTVSMVGAWFGDVGVAELHEIPDPVFGDSFAPPMRMVPAPGGWEVTGRATFVSNCHHIDWYFGLGMEFSGDQPKLGPSGTPQAMTFAVPQGQFEVVENWNTLGMRGTGSHDVRVDGVLVPAQRVALFEPIQEARNRAYRAPLYALGAIWLGITSMGAVALGIAGAAYDCFLELCRSKTPNYSAAKVGDISLTHYRLGEAHAHLEAARRNLYSSLADAWARVEGGSPLCVKDKAGLEAAATFAHQAAQHALQLMGESAGTSMIREEHPLSRHARDLQTLTQHVFTSRNRYQDVGLMLLGREPGFEMLKH
jgi:alkylation response protein AidB-like acyl-CoA dehydrogenase